jgi:hypothetical protein
MTALHSTLVLAALGLAACAGPETAAAGEDADANAAVRVAVFNVWELRRDKLDRVDDAGRGAHPQLRGAAEIVQRVRPDVLLVNEIDFDAAGENARLFVDRYLRVAQHESLAGIDYPHVFVAPVNTGVPTGLDLDRDGEAGGPGDAYGFGRYPGEYGMALLSRLPIDAAGARTFRTLLWRDVPGHLMPDGAGGRPAWYSPEEAAVLRLSSKSHWDVPVRVGARTLHVLAAHPTPPAFDGEEDRNGRRNFDEIRLWADYLSGGEAASYLVDDEGRRGALPPDASFVILGDLNADPHNDEGVYGRTAVSQLLAHPRLRDPAPSAPGGVSEARAYEGEKDRRTSSWGRLDYALPGRDLEVRGAGVFWPAPEDPLHRLVAGEEASSDHRLVWVDVALPPEN